MYLYKLHIWSSLLSLRLEIPSWESYAASLGVVTNLDAKVCGDGDEPFTRSCFIELPAFADLEIERWQSGEI